MAFFWSALTRKALPLRGKNLPKTRASEATSFRITDRGKKVVAKSAFLWSALTKKTLQTLTLRGETCPKHESSKRRILFETSEGGKGLCK